MRSPSARLHALERAVLSEELVSVIRHDLANKLATVRNATFFIRRKVDQAGAVDDPRVARFFQLIEEELIAANQILVTRLRMEAPDFIAAAPPELTACVNEALHLVALPADVTVCTQCQRTALPGTAEEMVLLIRCLVDNAIDAMPQGGTLTLATNRAGDATVLSVSDTGAGLTAHDAEHAFEIFFTTKPGHSGLGLNLARRIARRFNATIAIANSTGGARFEVRFPDIKDSEIPECGT